jgi:hypothetical protein
MPEGGDVPDLWLSWLKWIEALMINNQMPLSGNVSQWIEVWGHAVGQVGVLNINMDNSGNPEAEEEIFKEYSYGRQLGRILDVLAPIVKEHAPQLLAEGTLKNSKLDDFNRMATDIEATKRDAAINRRYRTITEIQEALEVMRNSFPSEFYDSFEPILQHLEALRTRATQH